VVAEAPLDVYSESAINQKLSDLDWVARAAVAHEAVVESFIGAAALLPMKLFTIFTSDARAIRVVIDRAKAAGAATDRSRRPARARPERASGVDYLRRKKAQRDATTELARRARGVVADLYDDLAEHAGDAARRPAAELPIQGGSLLLDAAFLVPRARTVRFRSAVAKRARALAPHGYTVSLTGPWPPYSFMRE
jgi:hypothetical protein